MTNFKGDYVIKDDVKIAKNYLQNIFLPAVIRLSRTLLVFQES